MQKDLFSMAGKTVVFTGGCGNLGRVMVRALLQYGANVAVPNRSDKFDDSYAADKAAGRLVVIPADLKKTEDIRAAFQKAEELFGKIDVLVNCAAYGGGAGGKAAEHHIEQIDDASWEETIDGTLGVIFRCTREIIPFFEKHGGGNIVNIGSMYGMIAPDYAIYGDLPGSPPAYGAGKAGVIQFTRTCASQLAAKGIRVNSLTPGPFPNITPASDRAFLDRLSGKTMLGRTGKPEELSGALLLLASDASSFMTGSNLVVDGGMTGW